MMKREVERLPNGDRPELSSAQVSIWYRAFADKAEPVVATKQKVFGQSHLRKMKICDVGDLQWYV